MIYKMKTGMWLDLSKVSAIYFNHFQRNSYIDVYMEFLDYPIHVSYEELGRGYYRFKIDNEKIIPNTHSKYVEDEFIKQTYEELLEKWKECKVTI